MQQANMGMIGAVKKGLKMVKGKKSAPKKKPANAPSFSKVEKSVRKTMGY